MAEADDVIKACKQLVTVADNARECNEFVIAVAARCGIVLSGTADQIMGEITGPEWVQHGRDGKAASDAAATGALVVGGMTSRVLGDAHGHVVIIVKGRLASGRYPTAYWGSENALIRPNGALGKTINFSFSSKDRDNVVYASRAVGDVSLKSLSVRSMIPRTPHPVPVSSRSKPPDTTKRVRSTS